MKSQEFDEYLKREGETHERDDEYSVEYSWSESCSNVSISFPKLKRNREAKAVSSREKIRKTKLPSSKRSRSMTPEETCRNIVVQQKFEQLSSLVPGLNLKDEDSMLDDTISYLKLLQERVDVLEEQKGNNIYVEKALFFCDKFSSSFYQSKEALPEIEAKAQGKNVLIRVHCKNKNDYLSKVVGEIEKLHFLNVENVSVLPFGNYYLDITVTAQMSNESFTTKDIKRELREAIQLFM